MDALTFRLSLDRRTGRRLLFAILLINLFFTLTTTAGYLLWPRMDAMSPGLRLFTRYVLVQGQLATENVVAVWYSSMLLLAVAALSAVAWIVEGRTGEGVFRHGWLAFVGIFTLLSMDELGSLHERVGSLSFGGGPSIGWVHVLAIPIALVAAFMVTFAAVHLRRVPRAFLLIGIGVGLYVLNPFIEDLEMAMNSTGAALWLRIIRTVFEEVILELIGTLCFAAGIWVYVRARAGDTLEWVVSARRLRLVFWLMIGVLLVPARASIWIEDVLPVGGRGMLQNWFAATAWILIAVTAIAAVAQRRSRTVTITAVATAVSAFLGAGLYLFSQLLASRASWAVPTVAIIAAGLTLEALIDGYLFSFSPRSSTASPTLRRPRPNPS